MELVPADIYDQALLRNAHPPDWVNPEPSGRYHLVVIGAGTGGLVAAAGAAVVGARVALIERGLMGGDCLNYGCVPSKALLRAARACAAVRDAGDFGVVVPPGTCVDFPFLMERMRRLRAEISGNDSAVRFRRLGVDVYLGCARFTGADTIEVEGKKLRFRKAVIATGTRPAAASIKGLAKAGFLTNETVFSLTELPRRLAVIGAGPIGCELAQAFARFGSSVTLLGNHLHILPREDADAARLVEKSMRQDGVKVVPDCSIRKIEKRADKIVHLECGGVSRELAVDEILVAVGRAPNVEGLNLEAAGVAFDGRHGVEVNDRLQTTNPDVYAAGDICSRFKFTHAADAMARLVVRNALFPGSAKASQLIIPWCTYTDPELAHVGLYEREAVERGIAVQTFTQELRHVDRALLDGASNGFVKIHVKAGSDRILGATVVAAHAGELISELTLAMTGGLGLRTLGLTIHPYPTQGEALRKTADAYGRTRLTPFVKWFLGKCLAWKMERRLRPRISVRRQSASGDQARRTMTSFSLVKLALLALFVAGAVFFRYTETGRTVTPAAIVDHVESYEPFTSRLVYILVYIAGTILLLPGTLLSFAGAVLFGPYEGTPYTWIGATIGAVFAFLVARLLGRDFVKQLLGGKFATFDRRIRDHGFTGLLFLRLVPLLPFNGLNFGCGLTSIRFRDYVLATAIGILPGTFIYQYLFAKVHEKVLHGGFEWHDLLDGQFQLALGLFVVFLALGRWLSGKLRHRSTSV